MARPTCKEYRFDYIEPNTEKTIIFKLSNSYKQSLDKILVHV